MSGISEDVSVWIPEDTAFQGTSLQWKVCTCLRPQGLNSHCVRSCRPDSPACGPIWEERSAAIQYLTGSEDNVLGNHISGPQ